MEWNVNASDVLLTPDQVAERLSVSVDWVRDHSSRMTPGFRSSASAVDRVGRTFCAIAQVKSRNSSRNLSG
jgi:hypothetical protein